MRIAGVMIAVILFALPLAAGELLDQVVATVNGNALLQSDWDAEVRYESFMAGRPLSEVSKADREAELNRIIDQELLREQMRSSELKPISESEVDDQMKTLQTQFEDEHPGAQWSVTLAKYGLSDADLRARVQMELTQLRIVDEKLRPSVEVDPSEVESYYKDKIAPQNSAGHPVSLDDAKGKIRELLMQQKINQALDSWLQSLRGQATIRRVSPEAKGASAP